MIELVLGKLLDWSAAIATWLFRRRRRPAAPAAAPAGRPDVGRDDVRDFATGLGQAVMGVREAVDHFDHYGVLLEPDTGALEESGAERLHEARRVVNEAEARLPRIELYLGPGSPAAQAARQAVAALREATLRLRDYIRQPGEGEHWRFDDLEAAKEALNRATDAQHTFNAAAHAL